MSEFKYRWENISLTIEKLVFEGSLDRAIDPETSEYIAKLQEEVREKSRGRIIVIDLTNFGTWDTEGIRSIIGTLILPLVERSKARIGFCGPKYFGDPDSRGQRQVSQLFEDAKIKFNLVGSRLIPWEETIDETIKKLTS